MATKKIGKYEIIGKIGEGGMGAVYKAKHPTLRRAVILKQLTLKGSRGITERFKREARLMLDFRHEHIVQVYDHFKEGNSYYIAMEYIDGTTLDRLIQIKRHLSSQAAILIFIEICKGLKYAHDKNVIHRDIKPANILISKKGEVKLTDFGIATSEEDTKLGLTRAGMTLGTPAYMAPEQIADSKNVDKRADIYSMGVVLYLMVTGKLPFPANMAPETLSRIHKGKYTSPKDINPHIFPKIQKVIKKLMHYKKQKRYKDLGVIIPKFNNFLKKYKNQETINETLKRYIEGEDINSIKTNLTKTKKNTSVLRSIFINQKPLFIKIISFITIFLVIGLIGGYFFYYQGLYFEFFKQKEYGSVKVAVKAHKKYKITDENYINASLFCKENKDTTKENIKCKFKEIKKKSTSKYRFYESKKIYLKSKAYKMNIVIENEKHYQDIFIEPIATQKKKNYLSVAKEIKLTYSRAPSLPLKIKFYFKDVNKNMNITRGTNIFIYHKSHWMKWVDFIKHYKNLLKTGKRFYFKFTKKKYFTKKLSVSVNPYQTVLNLNVSLVPHPGTLSIKSNYKGLKISLNNSEYYFTGGKNREFVKIESSSLNEQKLILAPGIYTLTIKKIDIFTKIIKTQKININSGKRVHASTYYDNKNKSIKLKIY